MGKPVDMLTRNQYNKQRIVYIQEAKTATVFPHIFWSYLQYIIQQILSFFYLKLSILIAIFACFLQKITFYLVVKLTNILFFSLPELSGKFRHMFDLHNSEAIE